jgi:hypothetical protein
MRELTAMEELVMRLNEHETVFIQRELLCQLHGYFKPSDALVISMQSDGWLVRLAEAPQR